MRQLIHLYLLTLLYLSAATCYAQVADTTCTNFYNSGQKQPPGQVIIDVNHPPEATTVNIKRVTVCGINIFRLDANVTEQYVMGSSATIPSAFTGPSSGNTVLGVMPPAQPAADVPVPASNAVPSPPDFLTPYADKVFALNARAQTQSTAFQNRVNGAGSKLICYTQVAANYGLLLTPEQITQLQSDVTSCRANLPASWSDADNAKIQDLTNEAQAIAKNLLVEQDATDFAAWMKLNPTQNQAIWQTLITDNNSTITTLTTLQGSASIATYNTTVATITAWDVRATRAIAKSAPWNQALALSCGVTWFNKTAGQVVTMPYTDRSAATPAPSSTPEFSFNNSCLPPLTVSTGLGVSLVRNSTFGFEPQTNFSVTPTTTTQVIGYATDARISPLYVAQLNYAYLHHEHSFGMHIGGGAGVSTASSGTAGDLFLGNAFSFFHRSIFVTPSVHFTQRQELMGGYAVGNPQGSLTSVPTITKWKSGFAITITFPVLQ